LKLILQKLFGRASDLADTEPILGLFLGAALLAVFLAAFAQGKLAGEHNGRSSLLWLLYGNFTRLLWSALLVAFLVGTVAVLRTSLPLVVSPVLKYLAWSTPGNETPARRPEAVASGLAQP
jgi:hypothetical protein